MDDPRHRDTHHHDEEAVDGCTCDLTIDEEEMIADEMLPAAAGGLHAAGITTGGDEDVDGCDVDFNKAEPTADDELPQSVGGVV